MSKNTNTTDGDNEVILDFESFQALWQVMAKRGYKAASVSFTNYMLHMQSFTGHFFFSHLQLKNEQLKEFGYLSDLKEVLQGIKMSGVLESILYVGANFAFHQNQGLMRQAYNESLELYMKKSKDTDVIKQAVKRRYEGQYEVYAQKILDAIPDQVYASRIASIVNSFTGFTKNERKYLKEGLVTKKGLDESMVFDIANLHASYLKEAQKIKESK